MTKRISRQIEAEADGMRLEQYLRWKMKFTGAQVRSMKFRENGILLNGERARVSRIIQAGDILEIRLEDASVCSGQMKAAEGPLEILYEDDDVLAVWKEAGLVVHPAHGHYEDTLSNRVHAYFQKMGESVRIRSIGRLDRDTSGIVVFAKNQVAAARLWKQKEEGIFQKEYFAVCEGRFCMTDGEIRTPIGPMPGEKMKMCVSPDGLSAVTRYHVLRQMEDRAFLQVWIETGRTHQIRVHMASIGHALLGDILYGKERDVGLQLYAWKAEFCQPFSDEKITISKPFHLPGLTGAETKREEKEHGTKRVSEFSGGCRKTEV